MNIPIVVNAEAVAVVRKACQDMLRLREESYDPGADPETGGKYNLTVEEAAVQACKLNGVSYLLAPMMWLAADWMNDLQVWVEDGYESSFDADGNLIPGEGFITKGAK